MRRRFLRGVAPIRNSLLENCQGRPSRVGGQLVRLPAADDKDHERRPPSPLAATVATPPMSQMTQTYGQLSSTTSLRFAGDTIL
jgi:hypothetical protein